MPNYARIMAPAEVCDELIDDGVAVRPLTTRGPSAGDAIRIVVDAINTGTAAISIAITAAALRRMAAAFIRRKHPADPDHVRMVIAIGDETRTLEVDRSEPDAEDMLFDFFTETLGAS